MSTILVTGGCGYIGSHTIIELLNQGLHDVISIDNLVNSSEKTIDRIEAITGKRIVNYSIDLCDLAATQAIFEQHPDLTGVIHFAALKAVGESVAEPLKYYHNNFESLINILKCCEAFAVKDVIFSSSCTVYGSIDQLPVTENSPVSRAESPYGNTKLVGEEILRDFIRISKNVQAIALRYFNPVGAHPTGLNGELPANKPNNLVPFITQSAAGLLPPLTVFGGDYDTRDGSCIRDYIHVCDIAEAHVMAMDYLGNGKNTDAYEVFNLGSGEGVTVFEAVQAFEKAAGMKLEYMVGDRRPGDVMAIYSDSSKAEKYLGWKAKASIHDMMASAWKWQQHLMKEV